jgi:hypothetical protein
MRVPLIAIVKRDCETCQLLVPVLQSLAESVGLVIYSQDDITFPEALGGARDDTSLEQSWRYGIEIVPALIRIEAGKAHQTTQGWQREEWEAISGQVGIGQDLPASRPGCGSRSVEPGMPERLALRFGAMEFGARVIDVDLEVADPIEVAYDRGWSDGLPVVPPTPLRVARMLSGTRRAASEVVGLIPPNLVECTVEKIAINAVMAGCRPEYMPVILAAVQGALRPEFSMHGLLATLWFSGPVLIVNGPIARRIGMNSAGNALGQGNRANSTIGRALQLIIRNVGGGVPGEIDRSVLGNPGKHTFCFAEDESDEAWTPLSVARGASKGTSCVTLFHGDGVQAVGAQASREPESLVRSLAMALWAVGHPKLARFANAILVVSPEHWAIFRAAGWDRNKLESALREALKRPGRDLVQGAQGVAEGIDPALAGEIVDKFHEGGPLVVRAGGRGGLMSAVIGGWSAQRNPAQVSIVTQEITE